MVAAVAGLLLASCQSVGEMAAVEAGDPGWRVVERLGEARHRDPGSQQWRPIVTGTRLVAGAEVATGKSGRVIMVAPAVQISAGPGSAFLLPDPAGDDRWRQDAGRLRYRASGDGEAGIEVVTPDVAVTAAASIFDVLVDGGTTEVTVTAGELRLATPDGRRHAALFDGQTAMASGQGEPQLAVRDFAGGPYQPVEEVILPAIQPQPSAPLQAANPRATDPVADQVDALTEPPAAVADTASAGEASAAEALADAPADAPVAARQPELRPLTPMGAPPPPLVEARGRTGSPWAAAVDRAEPLVLALQGMFEQVVSSPASSGPEVAIRPAGMTTEAHASTPEPVKPATSTAEAEAIYDRLAAGMLDDLPAAVGEL